MSPRSPPALGTELVSSVFPERGREKARGAVGEGQRKVTGATALGHRWGQGTRFATSSLSQAGGLRRSPSTLVQPRVPAERSPRRPPGGRGLPLGNGTPEGSSHCPHPGEGTSLDSGSRVRRSGVLVPKLCAPERRQDPAASLVWFPFVKLVAANGSAAPSPPSALTLHLLQPGRPRHLRRHVQV